MLSDHLSDVCLNLFASSRNDSGILLRGNLHRIKTLPSVVLFNTYNILLLPCTLLKSVGTNSVGFPEESY